MKKIMMLVALGLFALPLLAAGETYKDVPVIDSNCSARAAANPDGHTRACALKCEASGFGMITADKKFVKFDAKGNEELAKELKASGKKDHLRADVTGEMEGETLKVTSIKLL
ncbi:MAG TPA: hypothetical protein VJN93_06915 [Candidatus Acidoferrum sp.]|nr:hypothetical protein [Candidatus Acidoferrum sp.]